MKPVVIIALFYVFVSCKTIPWKKGDEFIIRSNNGKFGTLIIDSINRKYVWYRMGDYEVNDSSYVDSLQSYDRYSDKPVQTGIKEFTHLIIRKWKPEK